jgi:Zn-dependent protease with chaperone function
MRPALLVFGYAVALAWYAPVPLRRLTARGISPRLGLAAWLTAMAGALASAATALQLLISAAVAGWPGLAEVVCRSVAGNSCAPAVYRSAIFELALGAAAGAAALTAAVLVWRYGRKVQRAQRQTRRHGQVARIAGHELPGSGGAVVLDAREPAAYCVPGRPATIVVTRGALAVLDRAQLTAVLAHERAHLAGRHHLLIALTRALTACLPAVPLFSQGPAEVARLAEMCADDAAARHTARRTLIAALLAMGTGIAVPAAALAATGGATLARVQRLMEPPRRGRHARYGLALATAIVLLVLVSGLVTVFAGPLAAHGIAAA